MATDGRRSPGAERSRRRHGPPGRLPARARAFRRQLRGPVRRLRAAARWTTRQVVIHGAAAGLSVVAGLLLVTLYAEYGYHPVRNTAIWAQQPVSYAPSGDCARCHADQAATVAKARHATVDCQSCHGPLADHARTAGVALAASSDAAPEASPVARATCLLCHEGVEGRPLEFPVVTAATHFDPAPCLLCHEPHAAVAKVPARISHSLDGLPDCLTCHGPDRIRPMPVAHPEWPEGDCLTCHLRRGVPSP